MVLCDSCVLSECSWGIATSTKFQLIVVYIMYLDQDKVPMQIKMNSLCNNSATWNIILLLYTILEAYRIYVGWMHLYRRISSRHAIIVTFRLILRATIPWHLFEYSSADHNRNNFEKTFHCIFYLKPCSIDRFLYMEPRNTSNWKKVNCVQVRLSLLCSFINSSETIVRDIYS